LRVQIRDEQVEIGDLVEREAEAELDQAGEALLAALPTSGPSAPITGWAVCIWVAGVLLLSLRAAGGALELEPKPSPKRPESALQLAAPSAINEMATSCGQMADRGDTHMVTHSN